MDNLVLIENKEPVTTSLAIAEGVNKDHHSIMFLVNKYNQELKEFGTLEVQLRKSGGRPTEFYYLNEPQTTFLITLMRNNKEVINFKKKLVKEFYRMKKVLIDISIRQSNEEWKQIRLSGKVTRRIETDTIEKFRLYSINQGSKSFDKFIYSNISKMENKALFIIEQKFPNIRELLTGHQIGIIMSADMIVEKALKEGMEKELNYKEIYQIAKENIETFASVIPKTPVPMIDDSRLIP